MNVYPLLLLILAAAQPETRYFHYERPLQLPSRYSATQTCAVVDPSVFAHAAPQLSDLRMYGGSHEIPYVIANHSATAAQFLKSQLLNLGTHRGKTTFDVEMPKGPYTDVWLDVDSAVQNFVATVEVAGKNSPADAQATGLGSYTIFDLTKQSLGRSTALHLPPSTFAYLHFSVEGVLHPEAFSSLTYSTATAVDLPRDITVAESSTPTKQGRSTIYQFTLPKNIPVDAIHFIPSAPASNFHRHVEVRAESPLKSGSHVEPLFNNLDILRFHGVQNGRRIDEEQLQQAIFSQPDKTHWTVTIDNGDDAPLALDSVRLEMFERRLCFDAAEGTAYTLYYGDAALSLPQYDYAAFFQTEKNAQQASLGPEQANPRYTPRPDERPFTERHPSLLWSALLLAVVVLGGIAVRSAKQGNPQA